MHSDSLVSSHDSCELRLSSLSTDFRGIEVELAVGCIGVGEGGVQLSETEIDSETEDEMDCDGDGDGEKAE